MHRYVRTKQPAAAGNQVPVFLCNNQKCKAAKDCIPIEAVTNDEFDVPFVNDSCPWCKQKVKAGSHRRARWLQMVPDPMVEL